MFILSGQEQWQQGVFKDCWYTKTDQSGPWPSGHTGSGLPWSAISLFTEHKVWGHESMGQESLAKSGLSVHFLTRYKQPCKGPRDFHRTKSSCLHFTPSLNSNRHLMPPLPKVLSTWAPEMPRRPNSPTALWSQHAHSCLAGPPPILDHHQGSAGSVSPFFSLYTTFLGGLTQVSVFKCHPYANDSQIHFSSPKLSPELWIPESSFIWICSRHLKFNMSQTECLSFTDNAFLK